MNNCSSLRQNIFNDLLNVSRDKPCFEISTRFPSKAFIASAYSIEVLSLCFLLANVTLILKMGSQSKLRLKCADSS